MTLTRHAVEALLPAGTSVADLSDEQVRKVFDLVVPHDKDRTGPPLFPAPVPPLGIAPE